MKHKRTRRYGNVGEISEREDWSMKSLVGPRIKLNIINYWQVEHILVILNKILWKKIHVLIKNLRSDNIASHRSRC